MKLKVFSLIAAMALVIATQAQTADEVLAKYFQNTGGLDKWRNLTSLKMEGKAPSPQGEFPITIYNKAPNKSKIVLNIQGKEFVVQAYDGTDAWTLNPFAGTAATKLPDEQAKEIKDEEFQEEFIDYKKKGHEVALEGKEEIDGVQCYKIKLVKNKNNDKDDATEFYYFDAENYVPILQKSFVKSGPAKGTEISTYLSDYQEVNGLTMPFFMEQNVGGNSVFKVVIEKITTNENLDDSIFAFPK
jgi:outer membrane lipoprotein-sorting protein